MEKKGLMNWIETKLAPAANKFAGLRVVRSIMQGFMFSMPIIFVGVVFQIVGNIGMIALQTNPELLAKINVVKDLSYGLMGLFFTIGIAQANAKALKIDTTAPITFALIMYFLMITPEFVPTDNMLVTLLQIDFGRLGAQGMPVAIITGILSSEVCGLFQNKGWSLKVKGLPQFMQGWFQNFFSGLILVAGTWAITTLAGVDIFDVITTVFGPIFSAADTLPALMILGLLSAFMFFIGIHPIAVYSVLLPFLMTGAAENAAMFDAGIPQMLSNGYHLNTFGTFLVFIAIGGSGATLGLNFLMLRSKSKSVRQLGKTALVPSLLNINEPIIFGCPVAFNPVLGLGSMFVQGIVNPVVAYLLLNFNLVKVPASMMMVPFLPTPILALLVNMGLIGAVAALVTWLVDTVAWYPFFKGYEKQMLAKEAEEA